MSFIGHKSYHNSNPSDKRLPFRQVPALPTSFQNESMTVGEIRKRNLQMLVAQAEGTSALAKQVERDPKYIAQLVSRVTKKPIGGRICRHIEKALGKPVGWLDRPQWPSEDDGSANQFGYTVTYELSIREAKIVDYLRQADDRTKNIVDAVLHADDQPVAAKK
jgi:hypothetical protein